MELSFLGLNMKESATLRMAAKTAELRAQGENIVNFTVGEPDFNTPANIRNAAKRAIDTKPIKYTAANGIKPLRKAIVNKLKNENKLVYDTEEIVVSNGAKQSIHNALIAITNPGDEIIMCAPFWVSYYDLVHLVGGTPVPLMKREEESFRINTEDLENLITDKTKAIFINTPANPTGIIYTREELEEIAEIACRHDLIVISDEIYEKLIYDDEHISIASLNEDIKNRTIVINGLSKAYAMTGWRIGYTASNRTIADLMKKIQGQTTSCVNVVSQYAAIEALTGPQKFVLEMKEAFRRRRDLIVDLVNDIPGISCVKPKGAFYLMLNVKSFYGKTVKGFHIKNSMDFSEMLLYAAKVAVVPGVAFYADDYVRISYATSEDIIIEGMGRIKNVLK